MASASTPPPSAADQVLSGLFALLSDPEKAKATLLAHQAAQAAAEKAQADAAPVLAALEKAKAENAATQTALTMQADAVRKRETAVAAGEKSLAAAVSQNSGNVSAHQIAVSAFEKMSQQTTAALAAREEAVVQKEAAATKSLAEATALKVQYQSAIDRLQAIVKGS